MASSGTTVLISSVGATGAQNVIKALRRQATYRVRLIGVDGDDLMAGRHLVDEFCRVPFANTPDYVAALDSVCKEHRVDVLIPIMEKELEQVAANAEIFSKYHAVCPSLDVLLTCNDKMRTSEALRPTGVCMPGVFSDRASVEYPAIVKRRAGSGSSGVAIARDAGSLPEYVDFAEWMVQQYIEGVEYSVDSYCDRSGGFVVAVPRIRLATKGGLATKSVTVDYPNLIEVSREILLALGVTGPANLQYIEDASGKLWFLEINPRFGGGYLLSVVAGLNAPLYVLNEFHREPIEFRGYTRNLLMLRYWNEVFEENAMVRL